VTVLDLKPSSQDIFYLSNIQQLLADPNISRASILSQPPPFSPPLSAIWANVLLFLSLLISLTCALLATLLHQWARRYARFTQQPGCSPHKRARVRAFFSRGVDKCHVPLVVEALPTLLHLSICLFFAGLIVWLFNIDQPVFRAVVSWSVLSAVAYLWFTFLPIFWPNSPCYAPLSPIIWSLYTGVSYVVLKVLSSSMFGTSRRFDISKKDYRNRISDGIEKTAAKVAWRLSPEIDVRILMSTLDALGEDGARAKFFEAIPGFLNSEHVNMNPLQDHLFEEFRIKFRPVLTRFLDRTLSSNLVPESVKSSQLIICLNAAHEVLGPDGVSQILYDILNGRWRELLQSVEMAHSLKRWSESTNEKSTHYAHFVLRIVIQVVVGVRERNDHWISLVVDEFGVPGQVLRANMNQGDSLSLSLLIHITRRAIRSGSWTPFILSSLTNFDIGNTLPELQRDFCSLWNELVQKAWKDGPDSTALKILREIRHAYIGLHQGTEAVPTAFSAHTNHYNPVLAQPLSYRFCNIPSHRPDWTPQAHVITRLAVPSPTRPGFGSSVASTTQLGDSPNASPRSTSLEIQGLPCNADIFIISPKADMVPTVTPQAEQANIIPRFSSSVDLTMIRSDHGSIRPASLPSTPCPLYTTQRVLPATDPSVPESTRGLSPRVSIGPRQFQLALPVGDTDANSVYPEDPRPDSYNSDTGENPKASAVAPLPSPHPDADPPIINPLTGPGPLPPPPSIPDPDHVFDELRRPTWATALPSPPESSPEQDIATPWAESDISDISTTANPMPQSILSGGATLQKSEEATVIPASTLSDPPSSPITTPALCGGEIPVELLSSVDPTCILSDHISHALGAPSESSTRICSRTFPWPSSVLYSPVMPSNDVLRVHGDTSEMEHPFPIVVLSDTSQSSPLALDIGARTPQPDDTPHS